MARTISSSLSTLASRLRFVSPQSNKSREVKLGCKQESTMNNLDTSDKPSLEESQPKKLETSGSDSTRLLTNSFQAILSIAEKLPVPGISVATSAILQIFNHVKTMAENTTGWQELANRLGCLTYCITCHPPEDKSYLERFKGALENLQNDLVRAQQEDRVLQFFNAVDAANSIRSHNERLNALVIDWTGYTSSASDYSLRTLRNSMEEYCRRMSIDSIEVIHQDHHGGIDVEDGHVGYHVKGNALYIQTRRNVTQIYRNDIRVRRGNVGVTIGD